MSILVNDFRLAPARATGRSEHGHSRHDGFTLIELLIVVAIIGVLAGIALSVYGKVQATARSVQCLSNLKQVGGAIQLYENEHDGYLPGPLYGSQNAYGKVYYDLNSNPTDAAGGLLGFIGSYMGLTLTTTSTFVPAFMCPVFKSTAPGGQGAPVFQVNQSVSSVHQTSGSLVNDPWGYYPSGTPVKVVNMDSPTTPLSQVWAMTELDRQQSGASGASWASQVPATMVHVTYRNAIFFDGHAGKVDVNDKPQ